MVLSQFQGVLLCKVTDLAPLTDSASVTALVQAGKHTLFSESLGYLANNWYSCTLGAHISIQEPGMPMLGSTRPTVFKTSS